jgi:hypothetical protein
MTRIRFDGYALGSALSAPRQGLPGGTATAYRAAAAHRAPPPYLQRLLMAGLYDAPLELDEPEPEPMLGQFALLLGA